MEISTSTNLVAFTPGRMRNPMEFCIRQCAQGGYRVLDINFCEAMNPWSKMRNDDWEDYVKSIGELGAQLGVCFRQSHLPYYDVFRNPQKDPVMEMLIERSIIASAMLGVRWAVTHPATVYSDYSASFQENLNYYAAHLTTARKYGVGICLENDFGYLADQKRLMYCADVAELIQLVDAVADPEYMGICYDFGHANLTPNPQHRQNINRIGSRLKALHVQDNHGSRDEHLLPFHGNIDWAACMSGLAEIGYRGDLTFEVQEFGRYFPNDHKYLVVEYSRKIGKILADLYRDATKA